jgi:hypothetical protein
MYKIGNIHIEAQEGRGDATTNAEVHELSRKIAPQIVGFDVYVVMMTAARLLTGCILNADRDLRNRTMESVFADIRTNIRLRSAEPACSEH